MQHIDIKTAPFVLPEALRTCLPLSLQGAICKLGLSLVENVRLRRDREASLTSMGKTYPLGIVLTEREIQEIFQRMCGGSLYAYEESIRRGFLPLAGGIRVGVCGSAACQDGHIIGVSNVTGLMIRIPNAPSVCAAPILKLFYEHDGCSGLIYAPPGVGKTTLLRAVAKAAASPPNAYHTVIVDCRGEFSYGLSGSKLSLDVLVGYPKEIGIEIATRTMGAQLIVCDEIGSEEDARAILSAANCGVPLIASAHAKSVAELLRRPGLEKLHRAGIFAFYAGIERRLDGSFHYTFDTRQSIDEEYVRGVPC